MPDALLALSLPLVSVRVGQPETLTAAGPAPRAWTSAIRKAEITGPVWLDGLNLTGDLQADQKNHGGPDQALCVYPGAHYPFWSTQLSQPMLPGSFGENLTLAGDATEHDVCLGDIFRLGEALVQVSQPRSPCYKLGLRWQTPLLPKWLQDSGRTGWYMRVLQPGYVAPTDALELVERPYPAWPLTLVNSVKYEQRENLALAAELLACPALGGQWRRKMQGRVAGTAPLYDDANRLEGPAAT
ncbi:MOSC domain-containing protein [Hymenobacter cellulosilyticus]|uniref:MOSC domain-containing protein n=1 Tax=Hymenobacter cellulosilyticus TaxID=2932248 RepID=A0A8T9QE35_9BACT|nr:MOSC domain-containing protein [Hymenobacter cellulosilyticus]UOQ74090.1 MOSC domain-containing protein [Hymenobacter cellulosilyticus]